MKRPVEGGVASRLPLLCRVSVSRLPGLRPFASLLGLDCHGLALGSAKDCIRGFGHSVSCSGTTFARWNELAFIAKKTYIVLVLASLLDCPHSSACSVVARRIQCALLGPGAVTAGIFELLLGPNGLAHCSLSARDTDWVWTEGVGPLATA